MWYRRWRLVALLLLGAMLVSCGEAANGTGQPEAPVNQQQHDPVQQTTQLPQQGKD